MLRQLLLLLLCHALPLYCLADFPFLQESAYHEYAANVDRFNQIVQDNLANYTKNHDSHDQFTMLKYKECVLIGLEGASSHLNGKAVLVKSYNAKKKKLSCIVTKTGQKILINGANLEYSKPSLDMMHRLVIADQIRKNATNIPTKDNIESMSTVDLINNMKYWSSAPDPTIFKLMISKVFTEYFTNMDLTPIADNKKGKEFMDIISKPTDDPKENTLLWIYSGLQYHMHYGKHPDSAMIPEFAASMANIISVGGLEPKIVIAFIESEEGCERANHFVNSNAIEMNVQMMYHNENDWRKLFAAMTSIKRLCFGHDGQDGVGDFDQANSRRDRAVQAGTLEIVAKVLKKLGKKPKGVSKTDGIRYLNVICLTIERVIMGYDAASQVRRVRSAKLKMIPLLVKAVEQYYSKDGYKEVLKICSFIAGQNLPGHRTDPHYIKYSNDWEKAMNKATRLQNFLLHDMQNDPVIRKKLNSVDLADEAFNLERIRLKKLMKLMDEESSVY